MLSSNIVVVIYKISKSKHFNAVCFVKKKSL